jgi:hypothetical protein
MAGDVISFAPGPGKAVRFGEEGQGYLFTLNGPAAITIGGGSATWINKSDSTWVENVKKGDIDIGTTTWTLSDDGRKLMSDSQGNNPDGSPYLVNETYSRQSRNHGFYGNWMGTTVKGVTESYDIADNNDGSITWHIPELKAEVRLPLDGKEVRPTGPTVPETLMLSMTKQGPHKYRYNEKLNGKIVETGNMIVSPDGKTLTTTITTAGSTTKSIAIYERQ